MSKPQSDEKVTPTCLITGASAGIGAAIAREYAARGWNLALVARREAPMVELAKELKAAHGTTSSNFPKACQWKWKIRA